MLVSVITSVYNCQDYVGEMLDSILNQTFYDWECLVIDDASTDNTWDIIRQYKDDRIIAIQNEQNVGLTQNLNKGIARAKGKYIIRIDGDDIAYPTRFEKQVRFMEDNPQVVVSGGYLQNFGKRYNVLKAVLSDDVLRVNMLFNSVIYHPSYIIRKAVMDQYHIRYNEELRYAQDYNLLYQLMQHGRLANIPEIIVKYRNHDKQITTIRHEQQQEYANVTRMLILKLLDIELAEEEQECWFKWCVSNVYEYSEKDKEILRNVQKMILERNERTGIFNQNILEKAFHEKMKFHSNKDRQSILESRDKYFTLFLMMNQWVKVKQSGKNVAEYLDRKGFKKIAIYGMGYAGETLLAELQNTDIEVSYAIDRSTDELFSDVKVIMPDDALEAVDAIIVTAVTFFDGIRETLCRKINCSIISLIDILFDM